MFMFPGEVLSEELSMERSCSFAVMNALKNIYQIQKIVN